VAKTSQSFLRVSCRYETDLLNYDNNVCKIIYELNTTLQLLIKSTIIAINVIFTCAPRTYKSNTAISFRVLIYLVCAYINHISRLSEIRCFLYFANKLLLNYEQ
jgi:hypothetical protein